MGDAWVVGVPGLLVAMPALAWLFGTGVVDVLSVAVPVRVRPRGPRPAVAAAVKLVAGMLLLAVPFLVTPRVEAANGWVDRDGDGMRDGWGTTGEDWQGLVLRDWIGWCGVGAALVLIAVAILLHALGARRYPALPVQSIGRQLPSRRS